MPKSTTAETGLSGFHKEYTVVRLGEIVCKVEAAPISTSRTFDSIKNDSLLTRLHAYGFSDQSYLIVNTY